LYSAILIRIAVPSVRLSVRHLSACPYETLRFVPKWLNISSYNSGASDRVPSYQYMSLSA